MKPNLVDVRKTFSVRYKCGRCGTFTNIIVKDTHKSFATAALKPILYSCYAAPHEGALQGVSMPVAISEVLA